MKLHLNQADGMNLVGAVNPSGIVINEVSYTRSLVVSSSQIIPDWPPTVFEELSAQHLEVVLALAPELVLLGTGFRLQFPDPALTACLVNAGIGLEVMDTAAACRTFNILVSEGRSVVAALIVDTLSVPGSPSP